jgi:hypothetical protein
MTSLCVSARPCASRAPARLACARAPAARSAAALRPPPPLAAGRRARAASRRSALHAVAQWVLIPIGTGDSTHLDAPATLPPTILLGADKLVVGRELSSTVNLALPVPTGASRPAGRRAHSAERASSAAVALDTARAVSGTHAMIDVVAGDYYVTDLASTNGTYVDGEELTAGTPCKLALGAEVIFGACSPARQERGAAGERAHRAGQALLRRPSGLRERARAAGGACMASPPQPPG